MELPRIKLADYKLVNLPIVSSKRNIADTATQILLWPSPKEFVFRFCTPFRSLTAPQYLPLLIDKVEKICEENGLRNDSIVVRMTGYPNGCTRPGPSHPCSLHEQYDSRVFRGRVCW
jgi:hypothetical protein